MKFCVLIFSTDWAPDLSLIAFFVLFAYFVLFNIFSDRECFLKLRFAVQYSTHKKRITWGTTQRSNDSRINCAHF